MSADRIPDRDRPDEDVDAEFARIIAGWDDPQPPVDPAPGDPTARDPGARQSAPREPESGDPAPRDLEPPDPAPRGPAPRGPAPPAITAGPRDYAAVDEPDEGYIPPPPPPLPRGDVPGMLAWAAVIIGPLFLLFAALFWRSPSPLWLGLAVVAFIGGFVALVLRLPAHRDDSSDDDGAVV